MFNAWLSLFLISWLLSYLDLFLIFISFFFQIFIFVFCLICFILDWFYLIFIFIKLSYLMLNFISISLCLSFGYLVNFGFILSLVSSLLFPYHMFNFSDFRFLFFVIILVGIMVLFLGFLSLIYYGDFIWVKLRMGKIGCLHLCIYNDAWYEVKKKKMNEC